MRRGISEPPDENPAIPVRTCGCADPRHFLLVRLAILLVAGDAQEFALCPAKWADRGKSGTSITSGDGSFLTPRWRETDSNHRSLAGAGRRCSARKRRQCEVAHTSPPPQHDYIWRYPGLSSPGEAPPIRSTPVSHTSQSSRGASVAQETLT
jgi:hypothetical protein